MEILIVLCIVWFLVKKRTKNSDSKKVTEYLGGKMKKIKKSFPSAIPNVPKKLQRNHEEQAMEIRTRASRQACHYEASYSKGRPDHIGKRGDYETVTPRGMSKIRCSYCNADNFVPSGTHTHYHCYFCWEKL